MPSLPLVYLSDCFGDPNAEGRVTMALHSYFDLPVGVTCIHVSHPVVAAYQLVDMFNARARIGFINIAPRNGEAKKFTNGTPFCITWNGARLVIFSRDDQLLAVLKRVGFIDHVFDADVNHILRAPVWSADEIEEIRNTQFRGLYYLPKLASLLWSGVVKVNKLPRIDLSHLPVIADRIWYIDRFGNAKTTIVAPDKVVDGTLVSTPWGSLPYFLHLRDVPDGQPALVRGSSGLDQHHRLLEVVFGGTSAAEQFNLEFDQEITIEFPVTGN